MHIVLIIIDIVRAQTDMVYLIIDTDRLPERRYLFKHGEGVFLRYLYDNCTAASPEQRYVCDNSHRIKLKW